MKKPLFSICVICRNEAATLPRLVQSVKEFTECGGKIYVLDTGSSDNTVEVAIKLGCIVKEVGEKYLVPVTNEKSINQRFLVKGEKKIVKDGDKFFNFSAARNECAEMSETDVIFWADADEVMVTINIDKINSLINEGYSQFEYSFTFSFDNYGNETIKFIQSKAYDKRKMAWIGIVHELIQPINNSEPKRIYLEPSVYKLSHHQNQESGRHTYLIGLAVDAFNNPKADRQSHYFARELMWSGRYKSAIKEFKRHISLNGWWQERAQSAIYIGDCYGKLNEPSSPVEWYSKAFHIDSTRREALIKLSYFYKENNNLLAAVSYAKACLEIPYNGFYANNMAHYTHEPHAILYYCYGWLGNIPAAKEHIIKALEYQPYSKEYLDNTKYYFEYNDHSEIEGWMRFPEQQWLFNTAKRMSTIVEVGSWKGKSTHALLTGCKNGTVTAVDTWEGSLDPRDDTSWLAKKEDVYDTFNKNVGYFKNLKTIRKESVEAAKEFEDGSLDMVFIDAGHTADEVKKDIHAWCKKVKVGGVICGHDYDRRTWMTVCDGVDSLLSIDGTCDSIWYKVVTGDDIKSQKIPKKLFTAWLSNEPTPAVISKIIETQKIDGYDHHVITLENCPKDIPYVNDAISAKKWVKAVDYLRMRYLQKYGGIYLDADMEILDGKDFDELLVNDMFAAREENNFVANSLIGSVPNHKLFEKYFKQVESKFNGDDDMYFESSMEIFTPLAYEDKTVKVLEPEYFFPYNHQTGKIIVTGKTIAFHHFQKSWINTTDLLPTVSIIIPQLGRPEGLKRCLKSIDNLYYPKHLLETLVIEGDETVPAKIKQGLGKSKGDVICYAANDIEFDPMSLYNAVVLTNRYGLVAFNTGELLPDNGNINEHFIIKKELIEKIGGEIFSTKMNHCGVDNLLWAKASKLGEAVRCEEAVVKHYHFSKGADFDDVYEKGWSKVSHDRAVLSAEMSNV